MYESPITLIVERACSEYKKKTEEKMLFEIREALPDVRIDKEELKKALAYDRGQYVKGYNDRDAEIVRCKDCKFNVTTKDGGFNPEDIVCGYWSSDGLESDDFCSYGKRRGGEDE